MTALEALAILEAAVLECKKRDINTPEVWEALNLLGPHIQPGWFIPQYRMALYSDRGDRSRQRGPTASSPRDFPWHSLIS
jgi:hypothetical protein